MSNTTNPQAIAKNQLEISLFFANTIFDNTEHLALLNLAAARSAIELMVSAANQLLAVRDAQTFVQVQRQLATPAIEKSIEYSKNVITLTHQTKEKLSHRVESEMTAANDQVNKLIESSLAAAPVGSEAAIAVVKSVLKVASDTMEGFSKTAKKVNEVAEASVTAATTATARTATAVTAKPVKKAA